MLKTVKEVVQCCSNGSTAALFFTRSRLTTCASRYLIGCYRRSRALRLTVFDVLRVTFYGLYHFAFSILHFAMRSVIPLRLAPYDLRYLFFAMLFAPCSMRLCLNRLATSDLRLTVLI